MKILSVNAGSSSLKFRLYEMPEEKLLVKGMFERIGSEDSSYNLRLGEDKISIHTEIRNHDDAVKILIQELLDRKIIKNISEIIGVGHRVVHGGNFYSHSVLINPRVLMEIDALRNLAPLHNPASVSGIKAFMKEDANILEVACFDTAFYQTMKEDVYLYSVPYEWYTKYNVRKYGFHGLSHKYITDVMKEKLNTDDVNLIICHIGSGASITAVKDGKCIDTSMGFTPNAGLMMGTRSGDIDYSIISHVMKSADLTIDEIDKKLNYESGLYGIAGMSDLRDIDRAYESKEQKAILAVDMYTSRIVDYIAKYHMKLGRVDAICFTAGGGENDAIIRGKVIKKLSPINVYLDEEKNNITVVRKGIQGIITTPESKIPCYVIATDEELMIARDTYKLVNHE